MATSLDYPIPGFRFKVEFYVSTPKGQKKGEQKLLCRGAFSECSGLEATMEPKSIKVGGQNYGQVHRAGRVNFATVILRRGLASNRDMWTWFDLVGNGAYAYRLDAEVSVLDFQPKDKPSVMMTWKMRNALPTKFKTADFNAKGGSEVAIEELHFVHEGLTHTVSKAGGG
jgi:phage tail-like protein